MSAAPTNDMQCEEALRLLAEHLDNELTGEADARLTTHLQMCRSCWSRAEFETRLKHMLGTLATAAPDPAFEDRMRRLVASFTGTPTATE